MLAGTFSVLAVLPLTFLTQLGFVIAFGVLLDTFLVRSVLVPALVFGIGPKVVAARRSSLENRQVPVQLPTRHPNPILVPLLPLDLDVAVEHVLAQRPQDEL